jgi:hypothetical protein
MNMGSLALAVDDDVGAARHDAQWAGEPQS